MNVVYIATNTKNGKKYVGVTIDFKRRLKEHKNSPYPFGRAIRKYGIDNFTFSFEEFLDNADAYTREAELVTEVQVYSDDYYNIRVGGLSQAMLGDLNPMRKQEVKDNHPNLWTKENNPMNNLCSKKKMIQSQSSKKVSVCGIVYYGVREAARKTDSSRQKLVHRLKSDNFPDHFYL